MLRAPRPECTTGDCPQRPPCKTGCQDQGPGMSTLSWSYRQCSLVVRQPLTSDRSQAQHCNNILLSNKMHAGM